MAMGVLLPIEVAGVIKAMKDRGYKMFSGDGNLNIIGFRNPNGAVNAFDDRIVVIMTQGHDTVGLCWPATTDPGFYWLENPTRVAGTAILVPGQYREAYTLGLHKGKQALVQRAVLRVFRDGNHDRRLDMEPRTIEEADASHGINIHRAGKSSTQVSKWSAGCQVFADSDDFETFLALCRSQVSAGWGNKFTYTLFDNVWPFVQS